MAGHESVAGWSSSFECSEGPGKLGQPFQPHAPTPHPQSLWVPPTGNIECVEERVSVPCNGLLVLLTCVRVPCCVLQQIGPYCGVTPVSEVE